jgi:hypothetical protein
MAIFIVIVVVAAIAFLGYHFTSVLAILGYVFVGALGAFVTSWTDRLADKSLQRFCSRPWMNTKLFWIVFLTALCAMVWWRGEPTLVIASGLLLCQTVPRQALLGKAISNLCISTRNS